jgi:hypothetical protein
MLRVYMGYDVRDVVAYEVCRASLLRHASIPVEVIPLKDHELRAAGIYWRSYRVDERGQRWDDRDGKPFSTDFSFARFCVPLLEGESNDWVLFQDPDMLWRADVAELLKLADDRFALMCVQHDHRPPETDKMAGLLQTVYKRKNWSSLMLMKPQGCRSLSRYHINNQTGSWLHSLVWLEDDVIGALPEKWNWLDGWSDPTVDPAVVHFTRGTPDLIGDDMPYAQEWHDELARIKVPSWVV